MSVYLIKLVFLFLNQIIMLSHCGSSKELAQGDSSFEHPKNMLKVMDNKRSTVNPIYNNTVCPQIIGR